MAARNSYYYYYYADDNQISPAPPPPPAAPSLLSTYSDNLDSKISPSVLLIIAILAVIFFLSGLLHLLIRYLLRPTLTDPEEAPENVTALQGQLQQLFNLHDAGVDQSYIDTLPVFLYKAVVGVKGPFDCAVCLCEFEPDDKLRLLPRCSHAFHIQCIDTWLLSHSTCPLCRGSLLVPDFVTAPVISSIFAGGESSREIVNVPDQAPEEQIKEEAVPEPTKVVAVKLGKFRNLDPAAIEGGSGGGTSSNLDGRRCFSMGSFEYVMDEKSQLQVAIKPPEKKKKKYGDSHETSTMKARQSRLAMSECDCHSQRENFRGLLGVALAKKESFSFSKTWRNDKQGPKSYGEDSRRLSSSSFPIQEDDDSPPKRGKEEPSHTISSEFDSCSEFDMDVEVGSCNNGRVLSRREETPSFARRTLLWVIARNQNHKVVNHI